MIYSGLYFSVELFPHSEPHIFSLLVTETGDLIFIVIVAVVVRPHRMHRVQIKMQPLAAAAFHSCRFLIARQRSVSFHIV